MTSGMYTTKVFNPKVAESYLNIGDPYSKQMTSDPRLKGKQFLTNPSHTGQLAGYFSPFQYATDYYQDSNKYIVTQPRDGRKLGFGTHDANRRDEFTLDIRAKQYRQLMQQEKNYERLYVAKRAQQPRTHSAPASAKPGDALDSLIAATGAPYFQTSIPALQYDIGRTSAGSTPDCAKCERDTFYCPHRVGVHGRRVDGRTHYNEQFGSSGAGKGGDELRTLDAAMAGQYTHKSLLKDFHDNNHMQVGKGF